jgi:putative transposase
MEKTFEVRQELNPDEFMIMPNHFHCIVRIVDSGNATNRIDQNVETHGRASLPRTEKPISEPTKNGVAFRPRKSISSLMAGFKSEVTKRINELRKTPGKPVWQSRFHDHIIRNDRELSAIRQYILYNPANWDSDSDVIETRDAKTGKQPWFVYMG